MTHPPLTLIAGPTASGKSRLALETARTTGAAILNADSQQLYADLSILSARPSAEDVAAAEHRLYGVADAADAWSVGRWARAVLNEIGALEAEGRPAILVGGTGLYFLSLTRGLADIPEVRVEVRDQSQAAFDNEGEAVFRRRLGAVDPQTEAAIAPGDRQRLVRAFSVHAQTGRPLSAFKADTRPLIAPDRWTGLVIEPERERLYAACDARVDLMIEGGALDEVRALMARRLDPGLPAMKAVGVRELAAHLAGEMMRDDAVAAMKQATRNYAKRQLTWFRNQTPDWPRHPGQVMSP
ncbi:MAG: tRNA (adenosine(37)-N6)-dimethylallyltransferase MiaA [Brevundimonas sp.]|uniref:tRNA (adenosine(37)-N6)-dimethylallyltransferase MiaA n=1 Tax=Brevundimonas sp. TaxID=1871086 RepID=UPI0025C0D501|nr:tRNA (adenosine(37)-N6)-dimethylallyltransferase MiaA [Brevundimonas sp.]MBX3476598.1 tRNA (adenosine(37)-N6)-dimethylallyltransferase MiaA [Brevundimonas sp.]